MDSDSDISEPFADSGSEYRPSSASSSSSSSHSSATSSASENAEVEEEFSITNGYVLKDIAKKSSHKIWEQYGILFKANRMVSKTKDRIFCRKCFEKNTIKRWAYTIKLSTLLNLNIILSFYAQLR